MHWYYADQGRQLGPVEESALDDLVRSGSVRDDTLVWREGMGTWATHRAARGPTPAATAVPPPLNEMRYCAECGRPFGLDRLVFIGAAPICAACKPIFLQRVREGGQTLGALHYAGFWIRLVALMIDGILLAVVANLIEIPLALRFIPPPPSADPAVALRQLSASLGLIGIQTLISLAIACAYETYFVSTRGATIGKMALNLKIVRADGSAVSRGLSFGRYFARWISQFTLGIGYIMAGFDDQKRALHDRICETRVIYAR